ncbi:MAG: sensor histidine kinase [Bacteroidales bacterium]|nr:sensor histidine kinase [Bacteroidales bacterium]
MGTLVNIIEEKILENGFDIDLDEGWKKLTTSQFGGNPGRAFSELIQNAIDSYPAGTPWRERKGEICTSDCSISITDWGEGMDTKRLTLLTTAGGTDKYNDSSKIGRFGLGFISIFNPSLGTDRITVITICEGHVVELIFNVTDPIKRLEIKLQILDKKIDFSTKISIEFNNNQSVRQCLDYAKKSLTYYPCTMYINKLLFKSMWDMNNFSDCLKFEENMVHGILSKSHKWLNVSVLCKYELIMNTSLDSFITGGRNMKYNLDDYSSSLTPYVEDVEVLFNINNLNLTISRDSYYLDWAYTEARHILNKKLRYFLYLKLKNHLDLSILIANQYIFKKEIREYISNPDPEKFDMDENKLIVILSETPSYRLNGRPGLYSLVQIKKC